MVVRSFIHRLLKAGLEIALKRQIQVWASSRQEANILEVDAPHWLPLKAASPRASMRRRQ